MNLWKYIWHKGQGKEKYISQGIFMVYGITKISI